MTGGASEKLLSHFFFFFLVVKRRNIVKEGKKEKMFTSINSNQKGAWHNNVRLVNKLKPILMEDAYTDEQGFKSTKDMSFHFKDSSYM
jgi:hypothetical protein